MNVSNRQIEILNNLGIDSLAVDIFEVMLAAHHYGPVRTKIIGLGSLIEVVMSGLVNEIFKEIVQLKTISYCSIKFGGRL